MKKINIFLLVYILLLCICLAGFSSVRLSHLNLLPTWTNFRKISALTCFLSVFTFSGAFFCLLCNIKLVPWILWTAEYGQFWQMLTRVESNWIKNFSLKIVFQQRLSIFVAAWRNLHCLLLSKQTNSKKTSPHLPLLLPTPEKLFLEIFVYCSPG